jgi:tRNA/tmRNA/rRNA uracil-C5-methylase (TrmA/RlmC/RlmD family)
VIRAIGFQKAKQRGHIVDVERCLIATDEINVKLKELRQQVKEDARNHFLKQQQQQQENDRDATDQNSLVKTMKKKEEKKSRVRGASLLLRHHMDGVETNSRVEIMEHVEGKHFNLKFKFKAGEFFQNNPYVLPLLVDHVIEEAFAPFPTSTSTTTPTTSTSESIQRERPWYLLDTYCGGGLFALSASTHFKKCAGIEVSKLNIQAAIRNAKLNNITNCKFMAGTAEDIFEAIMQPQSIGAEGASSSSSSSSALSSSEDTVLSESNVDGGDFDPSNTVVVIDPPRAGCSGSFLDQLIKFGPVRVVYVSCDPATQARDARILMDSGYWPTKTVPFDLFPQTRHIENVITFEMKKSC